LRAAQFALLTGAARLPWPATWPGSPVAELAEDLAKPVVYRLKRGRALVERHLVEGGKAGDGLVDPRVTGRRKRRPHPFAIHDCLAFLRLGGTRALPAVRYSPA
jgi:hypothetical protein